MQKKRITIFAGHYGSGKTTLALNYALWLKQSCAEVVVCDLDIVNPYFRTLDGASFMNEHGIGLISSQYANTNVDVPSIPAQAQSIFDDRRISAVIDVGGDDRGALALGRYAKYIQAENDYEMLLVLNQYRPLTRERGGIMLIKEEIEKAAGIAFTGIANNPNLGAETSLAEIRASKEFAAEISAMLALPVKMTAVWHDIVRDVVDMKDVFPIERFGKTTWRL